MEVVNKRYTMKIKYYLYSAAIIAIVMLLVFFSEIRGDHYRMSVKEAHEIFIHADPAISREEADALGPELLEVEILSGGKGRETSNHLAIPFEELGDHAFVRRLKKHKGPVLIIADEYSLAAPAWLILTRMGVSDLRILDGDDNENMKYVFEPLLKEDIR